MISRSAVNTVGLRLRSSSVNSRSSSGTTTLSSPSGRIRVPARRRAARSTGRSTWPRSFSARTVTRLPAATISAHGSAYAMCHRLYRPGYSMPELITPPRRSSARAAIRPSSAGSNGAAVRMTRTPSRVVISVRWASTWAPRVSGPGGGRTTKKRPPFRGGRFCKNANQHAA